MELLQPVKIFESLGGGDAAHWGLTDFYPQHLEALEKALNDAEPFDTGWYSTKKECQTARVSCLEDPEKVSIQVSCGMDSISDLVDSAIWEAYGGNDYAPSGYDAMKKHYPHATDDQIQFAIDRFESQARDWYGFSDDNYEADSSTIEIGDPSEALELIKDTITSLASGCEKLLDDKYQLLVLAVSNMNEIVEEVVEEEEE